MLVCSKACAASCWNPSPVRVEKLSTVPFSRISWATWWAACCFKKLKFFPCSRLTSYQQTRGISWISYDLNRRALLDWRRRISDRLTKPVEAVLVDFQSCIGDQQVFENGGKHGCSVRGPSFWAGNPRCMAECTKSLVLMTRLNPKKC